MEAFLQKLFMMLVVSLLLGLLNGCSSTSLGLSGFESSKAAYQRCLEQNPDDPSKCEALRQAYEADLRALRDTSRGLTRGSIFPKD